MTSSDAPWCSSTTAVNDRPRPHPGVVALVKGVVALGREVRLLRAPATTSSVNPIPLSVTSRTGRPVFLLGADPASPFHAAAAMSAARRPSSASPCRAGRVPQVVRYFERRVPGVEQQVLDRLLEVRQVSVEGQRGPGAARVVSTTLPLLTGQGLSHVRPDFDHEGRQVQARHLRLARVAPDGPQDLLQALRHRAERLRTSPSIDDCAAERPSASRQRAIRSFGRT